MSPRTAPARFGWVVPLLFLLALSIPSLPVAPLPTRSLEEVVSPRAVLSNVTFAESALEHAELELSQGIGPAGGARATCRGAAESGSLECGAPRDTGQLPPTAPTAAGWRPGPGLGDGALTGFGEAAMTYDVRDQYVLLFGGIYTTGNGAGGGVLATTWKFENNTWTNLTASAGTPPRARAGSEMVYDAKDGYVVLFGGSYSEFCSEGQNGTAPSQPAGANCSLYPGPFDYAFFPNDTWSFSGGAWTELRPSEAPPGRLQAQMGYDAKDGYVVLFGGLTGQGETTNLGDTWTFSGGNWTDRTGSLSVAPAPRGMGGMAWDAGDQSLVLFGGVTYLASPPWGTNASFTYLRGDTWAFSGGTWTNLTARQSSSPSPRWQFEMSSGPDGGVILFGGQTYFNGSLSDTWVFGNDTWSYLSGLDPAPPPVSGEPMAFDPEINATLMLGGGALALGVCDRCTWEFAGPIGAGEPGSRLPRLTLVASVSPGPAPVNVSISAAADLGVPPYNLTYSITTAAGAGAGVTTVGPGGCPSSGPNASCPGPSWNGSSQVGSLLRVYFGEVIFVDGEVVDRAGNVAEAALFATIAPELRAGARFGPSGASPLVGPVEIISNGTGGTLPYTTTVQWGDGASSERGGVGSLSHSFSAAGTYDVTVVVSDYFGLTGRTLLTATVRWTALSGAAILASGTASTGLLVGIGLVVHRNRRDRDPTVAKAWYRELAETPISETVPPPGP